MEYNVVCDFVCDFSAVCFAGTYSATCFLNFVGVCGMYIFDSIFGHYPYVLCSIKADEDDIEVSIKVLKS